MADKHLIPTLATLQIAGNNFLLLFRRLDIQGSAQGEVKAGAVDVQLSAQLKSLATQCSSLSDIAIKYYATELPPKVDTSLDGLVKLIEEFPLRLAKSDHPEGVPLKVTVIPNNQLSTANSGKNGKTWGFQFGCIYYFAQAVETSVSCIDN